MLQPELLDRRRFASLQEAEAALEQFAEYYNYHRLSGVLIWLTPTERDDGTPFVDRGFENILSLSLSHLQHWLKTTIAAA